MQFYILKKISKFLYKIGREKSHYILCCSIFKVYSAKSFHINRSLFKEFRENRFRFLDYR